MGGDLCAEGNARVERVDVAVERREKVGIVVGESPLRCQGNVTRILTVPLKQRLQQGLSDEADGRESRVGILLSEHSLVTPMLPKCERM